MCGCRIDCQFNPRLPAREAVRRQRLRPIATGARYARRRLLCKACQFDQPQSQTSVPQFSPAKFVSRPVCHRPIPMKMGKGKQGVYQTKSVNYTRQNPSTIARGLWGGQVMLSELCITRWAVGGHRAKSGPAGWQPEPVRDLRDQAERPCRAFLLGGGREECAEPRRCCCKIPVFCMPAYLNSEIG